MRLSVLVVALLCGGAAAEQFPYTAYVKPQGAYVRSGPGKHYLPTSRLRKGDSVEVYRHDPGGWCAVRPPEGSFAWVQAEYVEPGAAGLGTVIAERVPARVGSQFNEAREVIQVFLAAGETVEILDTQELPQDGRHERWLKISPPAGEFRWVDASELTTQYSAADVEQTTYVSRSLPELAASPPPAAANGLAATGILADELAELRLELAMMLVEQPAVWQLEPLYARAQGLAARAATPQEQQQVGAVMEAIQRSNDIKLRSGTVAPIADPAVARAAYQGPVPDPVSPAAVDAMAAAPPAPDTAAGRFDGTGRLARVVTARAGAPRYALVDDQGQVTCYITPAPGLNLQYYVGRLVGVNGIRGYFAEQNTPHVTVKHVAPLPPQWVIKPHLCYRRPEKWAVGGR